MKADAEDLTHCLLGEYDSAVGNAKLLADKWRKPSFLDQNFRHLPLLLVGESKEVRKLGKDHVACKLRPTVYSYTANRSGEIPGTDRLRGRFTSGVANHLAMSGLGDFFAQRELIEGIDGTYLIQKRVDPSNIEIRVKRYHIGSPLHRYRYTEQFTTSSGGRPLERWSRFRQPIVCFDWRHPMHDEQGQRLSDEPLSDDYASVWLDDVLHAKTIARDVFACIEDLFSGSGLQLIDICFFVDKSGKMLFGEISPDCMRVRSTASDTAEALDKDVWRSGGPSHEVLRRYARLLDLVFPTAATPFD